MTSQRRKAFTIQEKGEIICRLENGESNSSLAKEYGVGHTTISGIFKNKNRIKQSLESNVLKPKRLRKSHQENVDQALFQWFEMKKNSGIQVSGPLLQAKAKDLAARLGIFDFTCSPSWISRFKVRHNISFGKIVAESLSVDHVENSTANWFTMLTSVWPNLRSQFSDDEIFNADETGLFYKLMPDQTLKFKGDNCSGGELSKDRITVLVAANMSGTVKKKLLIIGKSQESCFRNVKSLPVDYASNRRAWMTSELFEKWLRDWDLDLLKRKKKILLLVKNCPAHPNVYDLNSITLAFIPSNTSLLQPMDMGIIRSLKTNYRKNLVLKMINDLDASQKITVLDAILMVNDAWNKMSQSSIHNCFKYAGFTENQDGLPIQILDHEFDDEDDAPLYLWSRNLNSDSLATPEMWEDYVDIDSALLTYEEPTDENIVQIKLESDGEEEVEEEPLPTAEEALKAAELLSRFVHSSVENDNLKMAISSMHNSIRDSFYKEMKKLKQTKLTDYLQ